MFLQCTQRVCNAHISQLIPFHELVFEMSIGTAAFFMIVMLTNTNLFNYILFIHCSCYRFCKLSGLILNNFNLRL